jgi:hypothetical protein
MRDQWKIRKEETDHGYYTMACLLSFSGNTSGTEAIDVLDRLIDFIPGSCYVRREKVQKKTTITRVEQG